MSKYHPDFPDIHAVTPIGVNSARKFLLKELERYAASQETCCVYSFSTHCLKESTCPVADMRSCVVIEPKARDAVVIRKMCVKHP